MLKSEDVNVADMHPQGVFETKKKNNMEVYSLIFDIEIILRELIESKLKILHGSRWLKIGIPNDVREKVKAGLAYERRTPWKSLTTFRPLYYADFSDLKKIILSGDNWKKEFSNFFRNKDNLESSLSEIEFIRNRTAHNRFVSAEDILIIRGVHTKILEAMPSGTVEQLMTSALQHVPLTSKIISLRDALSSGVAAAKCGGRLPEEFFSAIYVIDEWWFDEIYLGIDVTEFHTIKQICLNYASIPSGMGQAIVRKTWSDDNNLSSTLNRANLKLISILGN